MSSLTVTFRSDAKSSLPLRGYTIKTEDPEHTSPPQLFVASLAACVGTYVESFCEHRGISAEGLEVTADYEKSSEPPSRISKIIIRFKLPHPIPEEHKTAVLKVAHKCLIHETILQKPEIDIDFA